MSPSMEALPRKGTRTLEARPNSPSAQTSTLLHRFESLVAEHKDMIFTFALYYLRSRPEAEDVTQEVLLKLWQHLGAPRGSDEADAESPELASAGAWLNRVTRNACFDRRRRSASYRRRMEEEPEDGLEDAAALQPDPEQLSAARSFRRHLRRALGEVPEPYRSVLLLRELQGLKYDEISRTLTLPLNTVKTHLYRGRRLLRERLRESHGYAGPQELQTS